MMSSVSIMMSFRLYGKGSGKLDLCIVWFFLKEWFMYALNSGNSFSSVCSFFLVFGYDV